MVAVRLAEAQGDLAQATAWIAHARADVSQCSASRFAVELDLTEARFAYRRGDRDGVAMHLSAARGRCAETLPVRLFIDAGEELLSHQPYLMSWTIPKRLSNHPATEPGHPAERDPLTARERQILLFMGEGHPNKVAAYRLGLSEATVKFHLRNIYRKLHAQNRTQALAHYRTWPRSGNGR